MQVYLFSRSDYEVGAEVMSETYWTVSENTNCYSIRMKDRAYILSWDIVLQRHIQFWKECGINGTLYQAQFRENGKILNCIITVHCSTGCVHVQGRGAHSFMENLFPQIDYEARLHLLNGI